MHAFHGVSPLHRTLIYSYIYYITYAMFCATFELLRDATRQAPTQLYAVACHIFQNDLSPCSLFCHLFLFFMQMFEIVVTIARPYATFQTAAPSSTQTWYSRFSNIVSIIWITPYIFRFLTNFLAKFPENRPKKGIMHPERIPFGVRHIQNIFYSSNTWAAQITATPL